MKRFKKDAPVYFDYRDVKTLARYINIYGQIEPIAKTGLSAKQQRQYFITDERNPLKEYRRTMLPNQPVFSCH